MKHISLIFYDIRQGIIKDLAKLIPLVILIFLECSSYLKSCFTLVNIGVLNATELPTTGNYFTMLFSGIEEFIPANGDVFPVPFSWLFYFIYLHYFLSSYPRSDIFGYGQNILLRIRDRKTWWTSKIVFVVSGVVLYYTVTVLMCMCFGLISGGISFIPSEKLVVFDISYEFSLLSTSSVIIWLIIMPFLLSLSLSLLQLFMDFLLSPTVSLIIVAVIYIASTYYLSPLLPGEYGMMKRTISYTLNGVKLEYGLLLYIVIIVVSLLLGYRLFNRYDILASNKSNEE